MGPYVTKAGVPGALQVMTAAPSPLGLRWSTTTIDLGKYTGVVRVRTELVHDGGDRPGPRIYNIQLKTFQSVTNNTMPPRYYWMRNDINWESADLGIDPSRSFNYNHAATVTSKRITAEDPTKAAYAQSATYLVTNPVDIVTLYASPYDAARIQQNMATFVPSPQPAGMTVSATGAGSKVLNIAHAANSNTSMTGRLDLKFSGDFDVTVDFSSFFGTPQGVLGNQKAGLMIYGSDDNRFDGTINNFLKCLVADDSRLHIEREINNEGLIETEHGLRGATPSGKIRVIRQDGAVNVFYDPQIARNENKSDGAYLVDSFNWVDDVYLAMTSQGAVAAGSPATTHQFEIVHARALGTNPLTFSISNDDGGTWQKVTPGIPAYLGNGGNMLRWKVDAQVGDDFQGIETMQIHGASYKIERFGSMNLVNTQMEVEAEMAGGKTFTRYVYWTDVDKTTTRIFSDELLRESSLTEALIAKVVLHIDAEKKTQIREVVNYKNKVHLSAQGKLLHEAYEITSDRAPDGFFVETPFKVEEVGAIDNQTKSGAYQLQILHAKDGDGNLIDDKVMVKWNNTYHQVGGLAQFDYAAIAGTTFTISGDTEAGDLTVTAGPEAPETLPRLDTIRVIDSQPSLTDGSIQEQVTLNWGRRPRVITVFDGHPDTDVIANTVSHEGFTAHKVNDTLVKGKKTAGFWKAETQW